MKATTQPEFSNPENNVFSDKLLRLTREFPIAYVFYHSAGAITPAHVIVVTLEQKDVALIESRKWIRNHGGTGNIHFHVISEGKMDFEYRTGNPFVACYCRKSAMVYGNPQAREFKDSEWKSFKKKFNTYSEEYYHDRDILRTEVSRFRELDSLTGVFLICFSLFEFDIRYLETLYIGRHFAAGNLHQRIKNLARFCPEVDGLLVKKNGNEYYLVSELEEAKEVAGGGDEIRLNEDLTDSILEVETMLSKMLTSRFKALKQSIRKGLSQQPVPEESGSLLKDEVLSELISQLLKIQPVEEIYSFHQIQNHQSTIYFLLLIGGGLGTAVLNRMQQSVKAKTEGKFEVVLLGHSRVGIQTTLFYQQSFFQQIMIPENRTFPSLQNYPSIHWEKPYTPEYPDLEYYYASATKLAEQYFVLRNNSEKNNAEGLEDLFSKSVLRILRTYIFASLSYLPHYLSAYSLWKLCVYARPKLEKLEFLFEKLRGENFFKDIEYHNSFHHKISRMTAENLRVMDEILNALLPELKTACFRIKNMDYGFSEIG